MLQLLAILELKCSLMFYARRRINIYFSNSRHISALTTVELSIYTHNCIQLQGNVCINQLQLHYAVVSIALYINSFGAACERINKHGKGANSYNRSQQVALFLKFILVKNSICFGQTYCPSSGVSTPYTQQQVLVMLVMLTVCQQTVSITSVTNTTSRWLLL